MRIQKPETEADGIDALAAAFAAGFGRGRQPEKLVRGESLGGFNDDDLGAARRGITRAIREAMRAKKPGDKKKPGR